MAVLSTDDDLQGEQAAEDLLRDYERHYNTMRPHQGIGNQTLIEEESVLRNCEYFQTVASNQPT